MNNRGYYYIMGQACLCPPGYTENSLGFCENTEIIPPTITSFDYCLAPSRLINYTNFKTRVYNFGFSDTSIALNSAPSGEVFAEMFTATQWRGTSSSTGPMNRAAVWIDSDCDGIKNGLSVGQQVTISFAYTNTGLPKTMYVGVGADNQFVLKVNDVSVASTTDSGSPNNFGIWHVFPVHVITGTNYFNLVATGDGTANDSFAMTIYDNTPEEIQAATDDSQLNILFTSSSLIDQHIDVATCPVGYNLDTSEGQGNYKCVRTLTADCI